MKRLFLLVTLAVIVLAGLSQGQVKYTSPDGQFTANFPTAPEVDTSKDVGSEGERCTTYISVDTKKIAHMVLTCDYPRTVTEADDRKLADEYAATGSKNGVHDFSYLGGKAFLVDYETPNFVAFSAVFHKGIREYILAVASKEASLTDLTIASGVFRKLFTVNASPTQSIKSIIQESMNDEIQKETKGDGSKARAANDTKTNPAVHGTGPVCQAIRAGQATLNQKVPAKVSGTIAGYYSEEPDDFGKPMTLFHLDAGGCSLPVMFSRALGRRLGQRVDVTGKISCYGKGADECSLEGDDIVSKPVTPKKAAQPVAPKK